MTSLWEIVRLPLLEAIIIGALCGLVGALAVLRHRVFFAEAVTHGAFPGAVLGVVIAGAFGWNLSAALFLGAALLCVPLAALMYALARVPGQSSQAAAGIIITLGFALGYFLAKWFAPLPIKIEGFLTGSILTVRAADVWAAAGVLAIAIAVVVLYGDRLIFVCFDHAGFRAAGHSLAIAETLILTLIVACIVVVIPAVGTIVSIALIAAPAAAMKPWFSRTWNFLIAAVISGSIISVVGLFLAVTFDLSAGGMIAIVAGVFYIICLSAQSLGVGLHYTKTHGCQPASGENSGLPQNSMGPVRTHG